MKAWRLVRSEYAEEAFTGEGARRAGGRFSAPGTSVVYSGESLSLALLEVLVHLPSSRILYQYVAFLISFSSSAVEHVDEEDLPGNWRTNPIPRENHRIGEEWIRRGSSPVLQVPSAVVPRERNFLLNPRHSAFDELEIEGPLDPEIDPRI